METLVFREPVSRRQSVKFKVDQTKYDLQHHQVMQSWKPVALCIYLKFSGCSENVSTQKAAKNSGGSRKRGVVNKEVHYIGKQWRYKYWHVPPTSYCTAGKSPWLSPRIMRVLLLCITSNNFQIQLIYWYHIYRNKIQQIIANLQYFPLQTFCSPRK